MDTTPKLDPKRINGAQTTRFPDMLGEILGYTVRYRLDVDSSYLFQSHASVDVWSPANLCWNEVWSVRLDTEFEVKKGPDNRKNCINPALPDLASVHNREGAEFIAKSRQKILTSLYGHALEVLT